MGAEEVWIELRGLEVMARIGVTDAELEVDRKLVIDIDLIPSEKGAVESDRIEETVDYSVVGRLAEELATAQPHRTLERLAGKIAGAVLEVDGVAEVGVRIAKPEPPMPQRIDHVAVRVARSGR